MSGAFNLFVGGASSTASGIVTTGAQTFAGQKSFLGPVGVGFTGTPGAKLEVQDSTGASQIAFGATSGQGYLTGVSSVVNFSCAALYSGSAWTAKAAGATIYQIDITATHRWLGNTGLTSGNTFTPAELMRLNTTGLGIGYASPGCKVDAAGTIRVTSQAAPSSGAGVEIQYGSNVGAVICYDRTGSAYKALSLDGLQTLIAASGTNKLVANIADVVTTVPVQMASYTVATLPSGQSAGAVIWVSNESAGAQLAVYNGTNWVLVADGTTIVS